MRQKCLALMMGALALCLPRSGATQQAAAPLKDGVFVHVSHGYDDPHRTLMALSMAAMMSDDHDVLVYFDVKAVDVVLKDARDLTYAHFPSAQTQIQKLRDKGVVLMACPGCLKAAGKTGGDLAPGVTLADKAKFFSFTKGRILSLDY